MLMSLADKVKKGLNKGIHAIKYGVVIQKELKDAYSGVGTELPNNILQHVEQDYFNIQKKPSTEEKIEAINFFLRNDIVDYITSRAKNPETAVANVKVLYDAIGDDAVNSVKLMDKFEVKGVPSMYTQGSILHLWKDLKKKEKDPIIRGHALYRVLEYMAKSKEDPNTVLKNVDKIGEMISNLKKQQSVYKEVDYEISQFKYKEEQAHGAYGKKKHR
jgi:hypothetical protein